MVGVEFVGAGLGASEGKGLGRGLVGSGVGASAPSDAVGPFDGTGLGTGLGAFDGRGDGSSDGDTPSSHETAAKVLSELHSESLSNTVHVHVSEASSSVQVPPLPDVVDEVRMIVWSLVPALSPQVVKPLPGSLEPKPPTLSRTVYELEDP